MPSINVEELRLDIQTRRGAGNIYPVSKRAVAQFLKLRQQQQPPPWLPTPVKRTPPRIKAQLITVTYTPELVQARFVQFLAGKNLSEIARQPPLPITSMTLKRLFIKNGLWDDAAERRLTEIKQLNAAQARKQRRLRKKQ